MRTNQFTVVMGRRVILVPYEEYHVAKYHEWMQDSELQTLTASDRLSLEEEYAMQRSWREDDDKCTFIVLDRKTFEDSSTKTPDRREIEAMIGDVNLFFIDEEEEEEESAEDEAKTHCRLDGHCDSASKTAVDNSTASTTDASSVNLSSAATSITAEVELMIAEKAFRGHGRGKEAVSLLMHYGLTHLNVDRFVAKIGSTNAISLNLFAKLGFKRTKFNKIFDEVTLKADVKTSKSERLGKAKEIVETEQKNFQSVIEEITKGAEIITREELNSRLPIS